MGRFCWPPISEIEKFLTLIMLWCTILVDVINKYLSSDKIWYCKKSNYMEPVKFSLSIVQ